MKHTRHLCSMSLLATILCFSSPIFAQGNMDGKPDCGHERGWFKGKRHDGGPIGHFKHMLNRLELSDKQHEEIKSIIDNATPGFRDLMTEMKNQKTAMHELTLQDDFNPEAIGAAADSQAQLMKKMMLTSAQLKGDIFAKLTPEQRKDLKQHMQKRRHRF